MLVHSCRNFIVLALVYIGSVAAQFIMVRSYDREGLFTSRLPGSKEKEKRGKFLIFPSTFSP
jgi:hypothetical protein